MRRSRRPLPASVGDFLSFVPDLVPPGAANFQLPNLCFEELKIETSFHWVDPISPPSQRAKYGPGS